MVASLFGEGAPLQPPSSGLAGFLRFLFLLAGHDWATSPLVADPQGDLSQADKKAAAEAFARSRDRGEYHGPGGSDSKADGGALPDSLAPGSSRSSCLVQRATLTRPRMCR